jgi:glycosyltransferase involved in cell wall biosynthesis
MAGAGSTDYVTVFYYGTFLPVANGGNTRLVELLERLHDEFERVLLYCYSNHPHAPWTAQAEQDFRTRWPRIELVLEHYGAPQRVATRCKNLLIAMLPNQAERIIAFRVPGTTPRLDAVKRRSGVVILSYTEALTQVNGIDARQCLVETHDLNFLKWSKIHQRSPTSLPALRKLRSEMALLDSAGTVLAISPVEFSFFRLMLRSAELAFVPTWEKPQPSPALVRTETDYDLVFVGSDYIMNVRGLCDLLARDGAWLSRWRVAVCGRVCEHPVVIEAARAFPNITLLGYVDRLDDIYRRSRAALSPVDGTGAKMKLQAALAAGLPVFASRQSRDGLPPGYEEAVFPVEEPALRGVLDDPNRWVAASRAARSYHAVLGTAGDAEAVLAAIRRRVPANDRRQPTLARSA